MPFLNLQSNLTISSAQKQSILPRARSLLAQQLEKSEAFCMVSFAPPSEILFGENESQEAALFANLKSLGITTEQTAALTKSLGALIQEELSIPTDRFYLCCEDIPRGLWGWNDKVF